MKIHLRENFTDTPENHERFSRSEGVLQNILDGMQAICGISVYDDRITDDINQVDCIVCKRIDALTPLPKGVYIQRFGAKIDVVHDKETIEKL